MDTLVYTLQESFWESVLGETHHSSPFSSAVGRQVSSRGSETRIWSRNNCTRAGPQPVLRSNEQNVTQESPYWSHFNFDRAEAGKPKWPNQDNQPKDTRVSKSYSSKLPRIAACLAKLLLLQTMCSCDISRCLMRLRLLFWSSNNVLELRTSTLIRTQRGASCSR